MPPQVSSVAATAVSMSAFRLTSTVIAIASPPLSEMALARAARPSSRRLAKSQAAMRAPSLGKGEGDCRTDAAGSTVTMAILSSRDLMNCLSFDRSPANVEHLSRRIEVGHHRVELGIFGMSALAWRLHEDAYARRYAVDTSCRANV